MHVEQMNRTQVIQELAQYAHTQHYHSLLTWGTAQLKALLVWYREA